MQILLDIPDTEIPIERAMDTITLFFENGHICKCNYPFKELPKGHGDLKDADKLKHAFIKWSMAVQGFFTDSDIASIVYNSPTIIEADKEINNECND